MLLICVTFVAGGFWHFGEFQLHRASHTGVKPFQCGRCKEKSFPCAERLTKHLKTCGITNQYECSHCSKRVSTPKALSIHISEVHLKDCSLKCPFCEDKTFQSRGGYYTHLRTKHSVGRQGQKLSEAIIEHNIGGEKESNEDPETTKDESET